MLLNFDELKIIFPDKFTKKSQTPKDWIFLSHFGQFVFIPHLIQHKSMPITSREDVFDALIIKIDTNTIPTTIPIKTSTIYHTVMQTGIKSFE